MTDTRRDATTRVLALTVLSKQVAAALSAARRDALVEFDQPGVRDIGVIPTSDGEAQVGSVQLKRAAVSFKVTDPSALLAWVRANHPTEVQTVEQVRDTYVTALLLQARKQGAPVTDDGEVIPGIERHEALPTLEVKPSADAAVVIGQAMREGSLPFEAFVRAAIEQVAP